MYVTFRITMRYTTCGIAAAMALLVLASGAKTTAQQPPRVPPALAQAAAQSGSARVIVQMDTAAVPEGLAPPQVRAAQRASIAAAQSRIAGRLRAGTVRRLRRFTTIPYFAAELTPEALNELARVPGVLSIVEDRLEPPALSESVPLVQASNVWSMGYDGTGWAVAILDTGVEKTHDFLTGKVVSEACYSLQSNCPNGATTQVGSGAGVACTYSSNCFHGTHVAGIAAGAGSSFSGVAKGASIIAIQVFSNVSGCSPCSFVSDQILGLERVYELRNTYSIAAVNMSLGSGRNTSTCDASQSARKAAIDNLRSAGIATVIASGNDGYSDAISAPACISTAVSVGSTTKSDVVSSFSNSASFLTLLAPGSSINSSMTGNTFAAQSGTSMATPHVAGAWAVLKQRRRFASVSTVLAALQTSAAVTDARNSIAKPRINVLTAITSMMLSPPFTDGTLTAGVTAVKAVHITELRTRIDDLRAAHGLAAASWTDTLSAGATPIKAVHVTELRSALAAAYVAAGVASPAFTDADLTALAIKAVHIAELRDAVITLEP